MKPRTTLPTFLILAGVLVLRALAACTARPDYLYVDPRAKPVRVELRKSFGTFERNYQAVPINQCVFYQVETGAEADARPYPLEIWRVVSVSSDRAALVLRYGDLPAGFLQATPVGAPPPPLRPGGRYTVECSGDTIGTADFVVPEIATPPAREGDKKGKKAATRPPSDRRTSESSP